MVKNFHGKRKKYYGEISLRRRLCLQAPRMQSATRKCKRQQLHHFIGSNGIFGAIGFAALNLLCRHTCMHRVQWRHPTFVRTRQEPCVLFHGRKKYCHCYFPPFEASFSTKMTKGQKAEQRAARGPSTEASGLGKRLRRQSVPLHNGRLD